MSCGWRALEPSNSSPTCGKCTAGRTLGTPPAGLIEEVTKTVLAAAGLPPQEVLRVWVLIHEQPDGTWGAGGSVVRYADLVALAQKERAGVTETRV